MTLPQWLHKLKLADSLAAVFWPARPLRIKTYEVIDAQSDAEMHRLLARRIRKAYRSERRAQSSPASLASAWKVPAANSRPPGEALRAVNGGLFPAAVALNRLGGSWTNRHAVSIALNHPRPWTN